MHLFNLRLLRFILQFAVRKVLWLLTVQRTSLLLWEAGRALAYLLIVWSSTRSEHEVSVPGGCPAVGALAAREKFVFVDVSVRFREIFELVCVKNKNKATSHASERVCVSIPSLK